MPGIRGQYDLEPIPSLGRRTRRHALGTSRSAASAYGAAPQPMHIPASSGEILFKLIVLTSRYNSYISDAYVIQVE
jgi:hypothetical protein